MLKSLKKYFALQKRAQQIEDLRLLRRLVGQFDVTVSYHYTTYQLSEDYPQEVTDFRAAVQAKIDRKIEELENAPLI